MSFERAVRVAFKKEARNEFKLKKNLLEGLFAVSENTQREEYEDVLGDIQTYNEQNPTTPLDLTQANRDTPPETVPPWRRRVNRLEGDSFHIAAYRWHSKYTGRQTKALASMYAKKAMHAMKRSKQQLTLNLMDATYQENPLINPNDGNVTRTNIVYPNTSIFIPPAVKIGGTSGTTYAAPFTLQTWDSIIALLDNRMEQSVSDEGRQDNVLKNYKYVAIFSVSGWASFFKTNREILANKDWYGSNYIDKDFGMLRSIQGVLIVTIPDAYFANQFLDTVTPTYTNNAAFGTALNTRREGNRWVLPPLSGASISNDYLAPANGLIQSIAPVVTGTGAGAGSHGNHATLAGMHRCFFLPRGAFELQRPVQLDVPAITYRDKDKVFERKMFAEWGCEGRRTFENVLLSMYFTDANRRVLST